ncbi:unnamed protein product [Symbiodinium pilosum]|uniref:RING-type domain-containing protein n=1 Tax=Symbiodinium pilosum TaxID=2952 RepID=A0A812M130_SYMPI|nr:unnamed protein product [Symbiodinium pilosum]
MTLAGRMLNEACETQSQQGLVSAIHCTDNLPHMHFESRKDVLFNELQLELAALGFSNLKLAWKHDVKPEEIQGASGYIISLSILIEVSWDGLEKPAADDTKAPRGGTAGTCAICGESRRIVVLAPCGHVMCSKCRQKQSSRSCPFCRQPVRCVTNGLFLN